MKGFRFVHCADLHLDTPIVGVGELSASLRERAQKIKEKLTKATLDAFDKIVNLCLEKNADFLLVAGDIFERGQPTLRAQLKFLDGVKRLANEGIHTYFVCGNHDPESEWLEYLEFPEEVHRFPSSGVKEFVFEKNGGKPARIFGISHKNGAVSENLARLFKEKKKSDRNDSFNIGLLHCNVGGRSQEFNYAPCALDDLLRADIDYWALGHIHKKEVIRTEKPLIIYAGNPQGRKMTETGERGCYLVAVSNGGAVEFEFEATDTIRFVEDEFNIKSIETLDNLDNSLAKKCHETLKSVDGRSVITRIRLKGETSLHEELTASRIRELQDKINDRYIHSEQFVWLAHLEKETRPKADIEKLRKSDSFLGDFLNAVAAMKASLKNGGEGARKELEETAGELYNDPAFSELLSQPTDVEIERILSEVETMGVEKLMPKERERE
ncbi:MAG: exonuclease SbcCD subunit D [Myxococcota bacterium]